MSSVTAAVNELESIMKELQKVRLQTRKLNQRKAQLEEEILRYMESTEETKLKYKGIKIQAEEKEVYKRKKKADKDESAMETLRSFGVPNPEAAYRQVLQSMRGSPQHKYKVKITTEKGARR